MRKKTALLFEKRSKNFYLFGVALVLLARPAHSQEANSDSGSAPPSLPAPSDTVLPRTGIDPSLSDLREHLLQQYGDASPAPNPHAPDLQVQAQIGLSEEYTTNAAATAGSSAAARGDEITALSPIITVTDTSQRLQVSVNYHPIGELYARHGSYNQIQQQGTGDILLTALPGWLFIDTRGSIAEQAVFGGVGPAGTVQLAPNDRETTSSISISPYVNRTFGDRGTVQVGAGYIYSDTQAPGLSGSAAPQTAVAENNYGDQWLGTLRGFANYTTGDNLGRLRDEIGTDDSFYSGPGALGGGRRVMITDDASYAVTRLLTALGEVGYENLDYPRSSYRYIGAVASAGARLTPSTHSTLTLEYRYIDGFGAAFLQGSVQASPRIRVFGGYSQGISTFQGDAQTALLDNSDDATGVAASALQASPLLENSNFFAANQALNRLDRLDLSATYLGERDTVTLSLDREVTTPIGRQTPPGIVTASTRGTSDVSSNGMFGSISEHHDLTPTLSLSGYVQYGTSRTGSGPDSSNQTVSFSLGLDKTLTETLSAYLHLGGTYILSGQSTPTLGYYQGLSQNQTNVTLGATKKF